MFKTNSKVTKNVEENFQFKKTPKKKTYKKYIHYHTIQSYSHRITKGRRRRKTWFLILWIHCFVYYFATQLSKTVSLTRLIYLWNDHVTKSQYSSRSSSYILDASTLAGDFVFGSSSRLYSFVYSSFDSKILEWTLKRLKL